MKWRVEKKRRKIVKRFTEEGKFLRKYGRDSSKAMFGT